MRRLIVTELLLCMKALHLCEMVHGNCDFDHFAYYFDDASGQLRLRFTEVVGAVPLGERVTMYAFCVDEVGD